MAIARSFVMLISVDLYTRILYILSPLSSSRLWSEG